MTSHRQTALGLVLFASIGLTAGCADEAAGDGQGAAAQPAEVRLRGAQPDDYAGSVISRAGDVNGDGHADLIVGAPGSGEGESRVYVLTGPFLADVTLDAASGFTIVGDAGVDYIGSRAVGVGDVNGDGLDDVLLSADMRVPPFDGCYHDCPSPPPYEGELRAFVVFGRDDGADVSLSAIAAGGGGGFVIKGTRAAMTSLQLVPMGDLDGDGYADFAIGAPDEGYSGLGTGWGRVHVVFGRAATTPLDLRTLGTADRGFVVEGASPGTFGRTLAAAGDVNGDGLEDLLIGDDVYTEEDGVPSYGRVYVVHGRATMERVTAEDLQAGRGGFVIEGEADGGPVACCAEFGLAVAGEGDIDGDGLDDIVVSAPFFQTGDTLPLGRLYVVHGRRETTPVQASDVARGVGGFAITGGQGIGYTLPSLTDRDDDGRPDVMTSDYNGSVLLYSAASPDEAETIKPRTEGAWYLMEGSAVGDLNDDGVAELALVGSGDLEQPYSEVVLMFR